jgi:hypothetical protein
MAKYSLRINRVTQERWAIINKTGEVITEKDNPIRYNEIRKKAITNHKAKSYRSAMDDAADACGLTKVYGAVSGKVYYE